MAAGSADARDMAVSLCRPLYAYIRTQGGHFHGLTLMLVIIRECMNYVYVLFNLCLFCVL
jgi:hypothetical protein